MENNEPNKAFWPPRVNYFGIRTSINVRSTYHQITVASDLLSMSLDHANGTRYVEAASALHCHACGFGLLEH
jgi:hypothetical protein